MSEYAKKMDATIRAGKEAMEKYLWRGDHYLVYNDPKTGKKFDAFYTPQLDGQYFAYVSGAPRVLPKDHVEKILATLREKVCKISKLGIPPNYSNPDGTPWIGSSNPYMAGKYVYANHQVFWLSTLSIYEGHQEFGLGPAAQAALHLLLPLGIHWDGVNCCSGYGDDGADQLRLGLLVQLVDLDGGGGAGRAAISPFCSSRAGSRTGSRRPRP